jgi:hypothetical protein
MKKDFVFLSHNQLGFFTKNNVNYYPTDTDCYRSCTSKYIYHFLWLIESETYTNYDWFYFCDDDAYVLSQNLNSIIKTTERSSEERVCIGRIIDHPHPTQLENNGVRIEDPSPRYPTGGPGFLLSKELVEQVGNYLLHHEKDNIPRTYYSDLSLGFWLNEISGIDFVDLNNLFVDFPPNGDPANFMAAYHRLSVNQMYTIDRKLHYVV